MVFSFLPGVGLALVAGLGLSGLALLGEVGLGRVRLHYSGFAPLTMTEVLQGAVPISPAVVERHQRALRFVRNPLWHLGGVVLEEAIFRGLLVGVASRLIGLPLALVVSGVGFGFIHLPQVRGTRPLFLLNAFLMSVLLTLTYLRASFWAAVALHYAWNVGEWQLWGYPAYGRRVPSLLRAHERGTPRPAGLEESGVTALCLLAAALLLWWFGLR